MKSILFRLSFSIALCFCALFVSAQKYGYINSALLLSELPEVKSADQQLVDYQNQLIAKGEQMVKALEAKYTTFVQQADSGALSQIEVQQKQGELEVDQQDIAKYEQEVQQKIAIKREELYKPILDKVKTVLDGIGEENGYYMIFDSSAGGILHAKEADDVLPLMKAKLGL